MGRRGKGEFLQFVCLFCMRVRTVQCKKKIKFSKNCYKCRGK